MADDFDYDVFLSFCSDDERIARPMWEQLSHSGLRVFWSEATLKQKVGELWPDVIQSSLRRSRHFLLIGTRASMSSKWVTLEWQAFLSNCYKPEHRRLIPALIGDYAVSELPLFLQPLYTVRIDEWGSLEEIIPLLGGTNLDDLKKIVDQKEQENRVLYEKLRAMASELSSVKKELKSKEAGSAMWAEKGRISETSLQDVLEIKPRMFQDPRGFFLETYRENVLATAGIHERFVQDNHSRSSRGVVRGLHYQLREPQAKLCRVVQGEVLDIAVDIRVGSPSFGKWVSRLLSGENQVQLYIPKGFAHGFAVRSETADFLYKCSDYYDPGDERGVLWNDPEIGIDWQTTSPILSNKDSAYLPLLQIAPDQLPRYQP